MLTSPIGPSVTPIHSSMFSCSSPDPCPTFHNVTLLSSCNIGKSSLFCYSRCTHVLHEPLCGIKGHLGRHFVAAATTGVPRLLADKVIHAILPLAAFHCLSLICQSSLRVGSDEARQSCWGHCTACWISLVKLVFCCCKALESVAEQLLSDGSWSSWQRAALQSVLGLSVNQLLLCSTHIWPVKIGLSLLMRVADEAVEHRHCSPADDCP